MKHIRNTLLIFALVAIACSCEKEVINPETSNPETIDATKIFINEVRSDRSSEYFIRGEFDGKVIYFTTISDDYFYDNTSWSAMYINNSNRLDQINLIRQTKENSVQLSMYFTQTKLFNKPFPFRLPDVNSASGAYGTIELINLKKQYSAIKGSPDDDFCFSESTFSKTLNCQFTSFVDNTLEGTFEGYLVSKKGSTIQVKNGGFRIKIKVVNPAN